MEVDEFVASSGLFVEKRDDARELLASNGAVLGLVREARARPQVAWSARIGGLGGAMPMMGGGQRALAKLLWFASTKQRLDGDYLAATESMLDALSLCEAVDSHPTVISNLVAAAVYDLSFTLIEDMTSEVWMEAARRDAPSEAGGQIWEYIEEALVELLDESGCRGAAIRARFGDRAYYLDVLDSVDRRGVRGVLGRSPGASDIWDRLCGAINRPAFVLDTVRGLQLATLTAGAMAEPSWPKAEVSLESVMADRRTLLGSLSRPISDSPFGDSRRSARLGVQGHFQHLARRRMAATALAVLLFEGDHGRRPSALDELVPDYLPQVPDDPFSADGSAIRYRADSERPVLYSIGRNGVDDGGVSQLQPSGAIDFVSSDIVFDLGGRKEKWGEVPASLPSGEAVDHDQDPEEGEREEDEQQSSQDQPE